MIPTGTHFRPVIITLLLAMFLLLPSMASVGMFFDGAIYASISRNLADGVGSMWALHFSDGLFPVFREHPPLVFWLQSLFFRVLGDTYLTERAYDLVVVVATGLLMRALWMRLTAAAGLSRLAGFWWVALLCWVLVPKWSWAYRNNVLENTMTLFCLVSVVAVFAALTARDGRRVVAWGFIASLSTVAAFLSKGVPGLFVLAAPVLLVPALPGIALRRVSAVVLVYGLGTTALIAGVLLGWPEAQAMLADWWRGQVLARSGLDGPGWGVLVELAKKLAPMGLVAVGAWLAVRKSIVTGWWRNAARPALAMFLLGVSASVPLVLGDRDSGHYLVPSLPLFAIALGLVAAAALDAGGEGIRSVLRRRPGGLFRMVAAAIVAAIAVMCWTRLGEVRKNEAYHELFERVAAVTGEGAVVGVDASLYGDWYLHAVAQRHYRISLDTAGDVSWRLVPVEIVGKRADAPVESGRWALIRTESNPGR